MAKWVKIATTDQCSEGSAIELVADDRIIALFCVNGEFYAIDGICAHQGGPVGRGELNHCTITCPWHGWQYDVRTGQHLLSESIAQEQFELKIEADEIYINLESS